MFVLLWGIFLFQVSSLQSPNPQHVNTDLLRLTWDVLRMQDLTHVIKLWIQLRWLLKLIGDLYMLQIDILPSFSANIYRSLGSKIGNTRAVDHRLASWFSETTLSCQVLVLPTGIWKLWISRKTDEKPYCSLTTHWQHLYSGGYNCNRPWNMRNCCPLLFDK